MMNNDLDYELILDVYNKEIRTVLEYGCVVYHHGLTLELDNKLEAVQRLVLRLLGHYVGVKMPYLRVVGLALDTEGAGRAAGNTVVTAEEEESFRMLAQKPDVYETIAKSIAPSIFDRAANWWQVRETSLAT